MVEGEDSSDSEGEYEKPRKVLRNMDDRDAESSSESDEEGVPYCLSFRRRRGPLSDFLSFYSSFRKTAFKLHNLSRPE